MELQQLAMSFILYLVILIPFCWAVIGQSPNEGDSIVKRSDQVLQRTFDDVVRRRRRQASQEHDQVVPINVIEKDNKSVSEFNQQEKDYLLLVHNAYRSTVQPFAASMLELVWDDEIAAFAQDWANQCVGDHRENRDLKSWKNMGENIYWNYGGLYHEGLVVRAWWNEVRWYNLSSMECLPEDKPCGHYITMLWAKSDKMGCGINRCPRLFTKKDINQGAYYIVCNYSGRFYSYTRPYDAHNTMCSFCYKTHAPKCRYNLCVTQEMLDYDIGYNGSTAEIGFNRTLTYSSRKSPTTPAPEVTTPSNTTTGPPVSITTPDASTETTVSITTPGASTETTVSITTPGASTETTVSITTPGASTETTVSITTPGASTETTVSITTPGASTETTVSITTPDASTETTASITTPDASTETTVFITTPDASTETTASITTPDASTETTVSITTPDASTETTASITTPDSSTESTLSITTPDSSTDAATSATTQTPTSISSTEHTTTPRRVVTTTPNYPFVVDVATEVIKSSGVSPTVVKELLIVTIIVISIWTHAVL